MRDQLNITELDFQTIKQNLIDHFVNSNTEFSDWDYEGSNLNTMLDVLAYNTHYNAMLAHMAVNESFIDSAQLRTSVVSLAKLLSYVPRGYSAAKATLSAELKANQTNPNLKDIFYLERGTRFTTSSSSLGAFEFVVLDDLIQMELNSDKTYYYNNPETPICVYEGRLVKREYLAKAYDNTYSYIIPDTNIDINTLRVTVYPTRQKQLGTGVNYKRYLSSNINLGSDDPIYFISENSNGEYEITFGNGIYGKAIESQNLIELEYLITSGSAANGLRSAFTLQSTIPLNTSIQSNLLIENGSDKRLRLLNVVSGGAEKETIERLKQNATHSFIAQNRAVTSEDYKYLIQSEFPFIQSISVWGGEDQTPPEYGKVFITAQTHRKDIDDGRLTETDKTSIVNFLQNKRILSIQPELLDPEYVNIVLDILFKYDPKILNISQSELITNISTTFISNFNNNNLNGFDTIFRHSTFQNELDNYNAAILNSLVRVFVVNNEPALFNTNSADFDPGKEIFIKYNVPLTVDDDSAIVEVRTNVIWTETTTNIYGESKSIPVYLSDEKGSDPNVRNIFTYTLNEDNTKRRLRDVGTIDLELGIINFKGNSIFSDTNLELKIVCIPRSNDIVGKRNLLVSIDQGLSFVRGSIDEIAVGGSSQAARYTPFNRDR